MKKLRVLNAYCGIGGNRKLWENVEVTAVELDPAIAKIYQDYFPNDTVIVGDAHQYLLDHYKEFDFIWSSPPCPTHSRLRLLNVNRGLNKAVYPDMKLYQEILLLEQYFDGKWVVENVIPYYKPLIEAKELDRHLYWGNFAIGNYEIEKKINIKNAKDNNFYEKAAKRNIDTKVFDGFKGINGNNKTKVINNMVDENLGLYILNCARNIITKQNVNQMDFFA